MWTAVKAKECNFGVAVWNYNGQVKHGLPIWVGDVVEVLEECAGWYHGISVKTKERGIFPASCVVLRNYQLDSEVPGVVPVLVEDVVASEVCCVLREWNTVLKSYFLRNQRSLVKTICDLMSELVQLRKIIVSGLHTTGHVNETKSKITRKIDWGNKRLGLDLVPRLNNEPVDIEKTDPIELFRLHEDSSKISERDSKQATNDKSSQIVNHHLAVSFLSIGCSVGDETEFHFALYDSQANEFFTERFLLKVNRKGDVLDLHQDNLVTVFTDLGDKDFSRDAYFVAHMFRLGSLRDSAAPSKTPTLCYKRPYGCGVCSISRLMKKKNDEEPNEMNVTLRIFPCSENDFPQFHETLIKRPTPSSAGAKADIGFGLLLKMIYSDLEAPLTSDPHLSKNTILTSKIGFPDVIMPDTDRNDLYLTIERGEFERGSKTAQKNVEVRVLVVTKEGRHVEKCISRGTGEPDVTEYNSFIFYHMNNPRWNDTIRLRIPVDQFINTHVRIEFRHCSNKDRTEKKLLGMCFVRIITNEFATLADGPRELCFYKSDDVRKLQDPKEYISLPDVSTGSSVGSSSHPSNPALRCSDKEAVYISTRLCSTKFTQNVTLLGILKSRLEPYNVLDHLNRMVVLNGEEIVKFLQYIMDALFDLMSPGNSQHVKPMCVFKAVIHVFNLLKDERFERFLPVMDAYISNNFSASLVYQELTKCSIEILEGIVAMGTPVNSQTYEQKKLLESLNQTFQTDLISGAPTLQQQFIRSVQVMQSITKCIVKSRILFLNCLRPGDREKDDFSKSLNDFFGAMKRVLNVETVIVLKMQTFLLHQIPGILLELSKLMPPVSLCQTFLKFMSSIERSSHLDLIHGKLDCLRLITQMPSLVSAYECKTVLIPIYVSEMNHFLRLEKDPKPVIDILMEVLTSLHCDRKLNVSLKPNLSVVLDGLLEEILRLIEADCFKSHLNHLIACLTSMLQLMDEKHFHQLLIRYEEKHLLEVFLEKVLLTLRNLFRKDPFPADWLVMKMVTNQVVLQMSKLISTKLRETFLGRTPFNRLPWSNYFHFAVTFVTQPCLQLERLPLIKRHKIKKKYGDLRLKMVDEFLANWQSLKSDQIHFIPEFVGPFLETTLIPEPDLRKAVMPIFFEMMLREWENNKSFAKLESELIDQLDILMNNNKGDEEFKRLFHSVLLSKVQHGSGWSKQWIELIESASKLLDVLLDYRNVIAKQDNMESRMKCIFNLLNYYCNVVHRQEKYIHYVYRLYELHLACGNHTEAALTLKLHSSLLCWSSELLPKFGAYPSQFEWQRLETIYETIISEFDHGKMWEYGLPLLEKLADIYKEKIMYAKLSKQLRVQADFYQKILGENQISDRCEPTYFLVRFFGIGFSTFLRNKEFIYRGNECEKLIPFQDRFLQEFSDAVLMDNMNMPSESITQSSGRHLQICVVTSLPVISVRFMDWNIPDSIRNFYRVNDVNEFYFDRPFHQGIKDENNDFKTLSCERYIMKTSEMFPGVMRWFEVTSQKKIILSPIEVAIDAITRKNEELNITRLQFSQNMSQSLNPLTMRMKGVIDAPVMGGFPKYQEAFFNNEFRRQNPQSGGHLLRLIELFNDQVSILEKAMHLHKQLAPLQLQPLHNFLEEKFDSFKQQISQSSQLIGYVPKRNQSAMATVRAVSAERMDLKVSNGVISPDGSSKAEEEKATIGVKIAKIIPKLRRESTGKPDSPSPPVGTRWYQDSSANDAKNLHTDANFSPIIPEGQLTNPELKQKVQAKEDARLKDVPSRGSRVNQSEQSAGGISAIMEMIKNTGGVLSSSPTAVASKSTQDSARASLFPMRLKDSTGEGSLAPSLAVPPPIPIRSSRTLPRLSKEVVPLSSSASNLTLSQCTSPSSMNSIASPDTSPQQQLPNADVKDVKEAGKERASAHLPDSSVPVTDEKIPASLRKPTSSRLIHPPFPTSKPLGKANLTAKAEAAAASTPPSTAAFSLSTLPAHVPVLAPTLASASSLSTLAAVNESSNGSVPDSNKSLALDADKSLASDSSNSSTPNSRKSYVPDLRKSSAPDSRKSTDPDSRTSAADSSNSSAPLSVRERMKWFNPQP